MTQMLSPEAVRAKSGRVTHAVWRVGWRTGSRAQALCGYVPAREWAWTDKHIEATAETVTCKACRLYVPGGAK